MTIGAPRGSNPKSTIVTSCDYVLLEFYRIVPIAFHQPLLTNIS